MKQIRIGLLALMVGAALAIPAGTQGAGSDKFIPTFLVYYGGGPALVPGDAAKLAKFDLIDIDRFRYQNIGPNTWAAIKSLNPAVQIYLYEMGPEAPSHLDGTLPLYLNGLGRYDISRGHFMGSLNGNHSELFLQNSAGQRIYSLAYSNVAANQYWHLMDFGDSNYQSYWLTAAKADIVDQPWVADGVFVDNCLTLASAGGYSAASTRYPTNAAWSAAMNTFVEAITNGMRSYGQKLWCNRGETRIPEGSSAWQALDASASPPDVVLEEGVFAVEWGPAVVWFHLESEWKRQVDTMGAIRNSKVAMMSHTKLMPDQSGTDNWGKPVTYWQTLWYALGSFLLAKNDEMGNAYFMFNGGSGYNRIWWHDEYDKIDLGRALGGYRVTPVGGVNIYWREFERGHVYVNPTDVNVATLALPQAARLLSRDTLGALLDALPLVDSIALNGHHAAFVLKAEASPPPAPAPDTTAPSVPASLNAAAVSATQVNLSWSASTDNVGVVGYYVYLNDAPLATTTSTSFSHTGLTAGATYRYRVSAFDAVPNHSAWTATPVAVTTPVPDTAAPTVPAGLTATAVSGTQVNLTWSASIDNVGVVGYYVYLNGAPLATTTATSFAHTGLTAGATYSYRVSAFDAVPNHSAWTAAPVAVTTPVPDTSAPSVSITSPAANATVSGTITVTASATDNVGVVGVQFKYNGMNLGPEDRGVPFAATAYTKSVPNGFYTLTAVARDAAGNMRTSAPITIRVRN